KDAAGAVGGQPGADERVRTRRLGGSLQSPSLAYNRLYHRRGTGGCADAGRTPGLCDSHQWWARSEKALLLGLTWFARKEPVARQQLWDSTHRDAPSPVRTGRER